MPYCPPLDPGQERAERRLVGGVARHHLIGQRQAVGRHHQRDHHLHAVGPMIARIAEAPLVAFGERRVGLEIGAGQIVEQNVEAGVEQVLPACDQMIEQRLLVLEQPVVTAIELVDLGQAEICAQEIGKRGALEPFPVQPPLAQRRQQPIGDQHQQHLVPARALAAGRQPFGPEAVEPELIPQ